MKNSNELNEAIETENGKYKSAGGYLYVLQNGAYLKCCHEATNLSLEQMIEDYEYVADAPAGEDWNADY